MEREQKIRAGIFLKDSMDKLDKIMLAMVQDKIDQSYSYGMPGNTGFLDLRQRTLAENYCKKIKGLKYEFYGGYEEAERRICMIYAECETELEPLVVLRITNTGNKVLTHRDYMGSILGLGIKRELVGDILVKPSGADIIILRELADFFISNYDKAGSVDIKVEVASTKDVMPAEENFEEIRETLASLRLDNMVAAAFNISRSKAVEAVNSGLVYINGQQSTKLDKLINQGDKVVLRGKGKIILQDIMANNKKDKRVVLIKKYR